MQCYQLLLTVLPDVSVLQRLSFWQSADAICSHVYREWIMTWMDFVLCHQYFVQPSEGDRARSFALYIFILNIVVHWRWPLFLFKVWSWLSLFVATIAGSCVVQRCSMQENGNRGIQRVLWMYFGRTNHKKLSLTCWACVLHLHLHVYYLNWY